MTDFKEKTRIKEQVKSRSNLIHKVYCQKQFFKCTSNCLFEYNKRAGFAD